MKNIPFVSILSLFLLISSCKQEVLKDIPPVTNASSDHISKNHDIHVNFIQEKFEGSLRFRSEYVEIPDAIDAMNEGLNSLYCRPGQKLFDRTFTYFDTIEVDVNGSEQIHRDDIADAMDDFAEFAGEIYYSRDLDDTSKVSWAFNVSQVSTPAGGTVDIGVMYIMQEGEVLDEEDTFPYEESWPWFYDEVEDETAACASPSVETGAEDLYRRDLRDALSYQWNKVSLPFYYLNLQFVTFVGTSGTELPSLDPNLIYEEVELEELINQEDEDEEDNYFDYLPWSNSGNLPNFHACLTVNEMNFHYQEMRDRIMNDQPPGTDVITNVEAGYFSFNLGFNFLEHIFQGWYAEKITVSIGHEEPENLPNP